MVLALLLLSHMPLESDFWDFSGGPMVKTLPSNADGAGSIPGQGTRILHALWLQKNKKQKTKKNTIKQKQYFNKFNKDFKHGSH